MIFSKFGDGIKLFFKYRHLLFDLVSRDLKVKYRRSVLGVFWSILNPILMMLVITTVFSTLFRFQIEYYPIYYLTGNLIFAMFSEGTMGALTSIVGASSLIKKVYLPLYLFPLEKCLFAFINAMFSLVGLALIMVILQMPVSWTIVLFFIPMIYVLIFSIGIGLILASVNVAFRDVGHLYGVVITAWMYLTPIFYPANILPQWLQKYMVFNPLYSFITYMREVVMYGNVPGLKLNAACFIASMTMLVLGFIIFRLRQKTFILYI